MTQRLSAALAPFDWGRMPAMAALWVEAWLEAIPEIDFAARRGWLIHRIGTLLDDGAVIELAVAGAGEHPCGRLLGFVTVQPSTGYVDQLVVHPDHWGTGIAGLLVEAAAARSKKPLSLDVNEENPRAVRFYEKAGFAVVGRGINPTSGRPTLRMERVDQNDPHARA